ncbi:MAG: ketopantoate reductase family protein [Candidatus Margulisiibacteriota bacterium]|nr:ketopantoate reductase family protein [Candidatus Margulisiibacteriota bacterium]
MTPSYRVGLIGAGAVGLYYASFFKEIGASLTIFTRNKEAYNESDFNIESYLGNRSFNVDDIASYGDLVEPFDLIIVATKVLPSIDIPDLIQPYIKRDTIFLVIQNGVDIETPLMGLSHPVVRGLAFICVERQSFQNISHYDFGKLSWGMIKGDLNEPSVNKFNHMIDKTLMDQSFDDNIQFSIWKKLLWNIPFNCLSVYYGGVDTNYLLTNPIARNHLNQLMDEVITVSQKHGIHLTNKHKSDHIGSTEKMKPYFTSMCLDYKASRPIELDAILGNFIKIAKKLDCEVPYSRNLYANLVKN